MNVLRIWWLFLVACSAPPKPAGPANVGDPSPPVATPPTIRVQLTFRVTFMIGPPFTRLPPFTLLDDGTLIGVDEKTNLIQSTKLSKADANAIARHVLDLGFERLENHTESCKDLGNNRRMCVSDDAYTVIRVALPSGLREITTYSDFSNEPAVFTKIVEYLSKFKLPSPHRYLPTAAAVHSSIVAAPPPIGCPTIDPVILKRPGDPGPWGAVIDGATLRTLLAIAPNKAGKVRVCGGGRVFELTIVPAVPGWNPDEELKPYHR